MEFFKIKKYSYIILVFSLFLTACNSTAQKVESTDVEHLVVDSKQFKERIIKEENIQLIDVRTKAEFDRGTITNAINYDFLDGTFLAKVPSLDKSRTVYVFCAKGGRSGKAAKILEKNGFKSIVDLKGGYTAWPK